MILVSSLPALRPHPNPCLPTGRLSSAKGGQVRVEGILFFSQLPISCESILFWSYFFGKRNCNERVIRNHAPIGRHNAPIMNKQPYQILTHLSSGQPKDFAWFCKKEYFLWINKKMACLSHFYIIMHSSSWYLSAFGGGGGWEEVSTMGAKNASDFCYQR